VTADDPRFAAYASNETRAHAHLVPEAQSFEEAAFVFLDHWHPEPDDEDEVSVTVEDRLTGERQCFVINLESGQTAHCD
jgi:hypothetical protein